MVKRRGNTPIVLGEREYTMRVDWPAVEKLRSLYGNSFDQAIDEAMRAFDVNVIAEVIAIALECHHEGELDAQEIKKLSPPLADAVEALRKAVTLSFYGSEEDVPSENPPLADRVRLAWRILFAPRSEWLIR